MDGSQAAVPCSYRRSGSILSPLPASGAAVQMLGCCTPRPLLPHAGGTPPAHLHPTSPQPTQPSNVDTTLQPSWRGQEQVQQTVFPSIFKHFQFLTLLLLAQLSSLLSPASCRLWAILPSAGGPGGCLALSPKAHMEAVLGGLGLLYTADYNRSLL